MHCIFRRENGGNNRPAEQQAPNGERLATSTVAMWTAISNPLLLISQVLRKSRELQESEMNSANTAAPASQCEFIIERHVAPEIQPIDSRFLIFDSLY